MRFVVVFWAGQFHVQQYGVDLQIRPGNTI